MSLENIFSFFKNQLSGKFQQDVLWNVASLGIIGISGILLNVLIGYYYDAAILGVFNQVYAAYIFFSQFAVGGVHLSTLKYVAEFSSDREITGTIIVSSICLAFTLSLIMSTGFWFLKGIIGNTLDSSGVIVGIAWATPGLFFFAINKVLLAILNGFRRMKLYAVSQSFRVVMMLLSLIVAITLSCPGEKLALVFSVAETSLFFVLFVAIRKHISFTSFSNCYEWIIKHFKFGIKSFLSGALLELNTRVDVLMLGYFTSDKIVGIYSFAAILAEGLFQFLVVLRTNFNPILVRLIAEKRIDELKEKVKKGKRVVYGMMVVIGVIATALYPSGVKLITNKPDFGQSWPLFAILMGGIVLSSGYIPFPQSFLASGYPGLHTIMVTIIVAFNIIANLAFIPFWEAYGAAFATALSFIFSIFLLRHLAKARLGIERL
jgi:O-antigen/teichoic acid export membrane protein